MEACQPRPDGLAYVCQPCTVIHGISNFLQQAGKSGILSEANQNSSVSSLARSIGQQLERAGFLQEMPSIITAAQLLRQLQDKPELVAAALADPLFEFGARDASAAGWQLTNIHIHLQQLFGVQIKLGSLWPQGELEATIWPALVSPVMQLILGVLQHVSLCLTQLPDGAQEPPKALFTLLAQATYVADYPATAVTVAMLSPHGHLQQHRQGRQQQQTREGIRQELVHSPYSCQALCLLMVTSAYGMVQHQKATGALPRSGTGGNSSSGGGTNTASWAARSRRADNDAAATAATPSMEEPPDALISFSNSW